MVQNKMPKHSLISWLARNIVMAAVGHMFIYPNDRIALLKAIQLEANEQIIRELEGRANA
jgi:hypothetical protein